MTTTVHKRKFSSGDLINLVMGIFSAVIIVLSYYIFSPTDGIERLSPLIENVARAQNTVEEQVRRAGVLVDQIEIEVDRFDAVLKAAQERISDDALRVSFAKIVSDIEIIDRRLSKINDLIVDDAEKALSVAFFKRDLSSLKALYDEKILATNQSIERLYSMFAWSIGGILIGVLGAPLIKLVQNIFGRSIKDAD